LPINIQAALDCARYRNAAGLWGMKMMGPFDTKKELTKIGYLSFASSLAY
jgi:hypothetical protein